MMGMNRYKDNVYLGAVAQILMFNLDSKTISIEGSLSTPRYMPSVAIGKDNKMIVAGGWR